ncbi:MAG: leucine-rich repeat domain-containing protein [Promethearchaeota archaeon]
MQNNGTELVSFRDAEIHKFEADVLKELESLAGKEFSLVDEIEWDTKMGFTVGNNFVTGIGLYTCGLTTLPESIGKLTSLETLWLNENKLTTLPRSIGNFKSLEYLYLENNQLRILPESIGNLSSLKELWLYKNQLTTLSESLLELESLETLYFNESDEDRLDAKGKRVLRDLKNKGVEIMRW